MPRTALSRLPLAALCAFLTIGSNWSYGQSNTATVYGNITDPSGAAVPSVTIDAVNTITGVHSSATSNAEGQFTFNFLPVGSYKFTASAAGFQNQVREGVQLSAGQTTQVTLQLSVSSAQQSVVVSDAAPF